MDLLHARITGTYPLIPHNGRTADPMDRYSKMIKEVSSKRKKTDADHAELARLEWEAALYLNEAGRPIIPANNLRGALLGKHSAARRQKLGKDAQLGIFLTKDAVLEYDGPKDLAELSQDGRFRYAALVTVQSSRIMRTRPIFKDWAAEIEIEYNPDFIEKDLLEYLLAVAGNEVGLMDWRPTYGRFSVEILG